MIGELAALGAAICWTFSALLYKKALLNTSPISANVVRCLFTGTFLMVCLGIANRFESLILLPRYAILLACVSGIIGLGIGDTLYMISLKLIGVSRAVPISCTYPLFNILWAIFLVDEAVTTYAVLGAVIIVFGIFILGFEEKREDVSNKKILVKGFLGALATAIIWSTSITMINVAVMDASDINYALAINTLRVSAVALFMLSLSPLLDRNLSFLKIDKKTLITLVAGGIVALGLGWFFLTFSFTKTLESRAVPISSTTPLFSTISGKALFHEKVTAKDAAGALLIVAGIFMIFLL